MTSCCLLAAGAWGLDAVRAFIDAATQGAHDIDLFRGGMGMACAAFLSVIVVISRRQEAAEAARHYSNLQCWGASLDAWEAEVAMLRAEVELHKEVARCQAAS